MDLIVYILVPKFCHIMQLIKKDMAERPTNLDNIHTSNTNCAIMYLMEKTWQKSLQIWIPSIWQPKFYPESDQANESIYLCFTNFDNIDTT